MAVIWQGACKPHTVATALYRRATEEDVANYHVPGSWVEYSGVSEPAVLVRVGYVDDYHVVIDAVDASGNVIKARQLNAGQKRAFDRNSVADLPRIIPVMLGMTPIESE